MRVGGVVGVDDEIEERENGGMDGVCVCGHEGGELRRRGAWVINLYEWVGDEERESGSEENERSRKGREGGEQVKTVEENTNPRGVFGGRIWIELFIRVLFIYSLIFIICS